jgi:hypothetical protein
MVRRVPFLFKDDMASRLTPNLVFGTPQIQIKIDVDENGLMRTAINKPLPAIQVIGLLLDCMQGQYQAMKQQTSLLIDPKRKTMSAEGAIANGGPNNGGEKEKDNNNRGGDSSGGNSAT